MVNWKWLREKQKDRSNSKSTREGDEGESGKFDAQMIMAWITDYR